MTTPGSHNDTYASTAHRMFFQNLVERKRAPENCPDNDQHNVDSTDAVTMAVPVSLLAADDTDAVKHAIKMVSLTRDSQRSQQVAATFTNLLRSVVRGTPVREAVAAVGAAEGIDLKRAAARSREDPVTA